MWKPTEHDGPERRGSGRIKCLASILGVLLLVISCNKPAVLDAPMVSYAPIDDGARLHLTWLAVTNATEYRVYVDGVESTLVSGTYSYDVTGPAKLVEVSAVAVSAEGHKWSLNTAVKKTTGLTVYTPVDAQQLNHAFYFDTTGAAVAIPLSRPLDIDFVLDTTQTVTNIELRSPDSCNPQYNAKSNSAAAAGVANFADLKIAPAPGVYGNVLAVFPDSVYSLWLDPAANGWSIDDHVAKVKVEAVSGTAVTFTVGYQKIPGLRWLMSN